MRPPDSLIQPSGHGRSLALQARRRRGAFLLIGGLAAVGLGLTVLGLAGGQQIRRDGFEGRDPVWVKGPADAACKELAHEMTDAAHTGQHSESIQLQAERGSFIHYLYDVGRAPLCEELAARVWIKANRPGIQLLARLVLPHERNSANVEEPLSTLIGGDVYQTTSRWQALELRHPLELARKQLALLRAELRRDVNGEGAYIDRLILNLYAGPGDTQVWIDDLEVGPVADPRTWQNAGRAEPAPPGDGPGKLAGRAATRRPAVIDLDRDQLRVSGKSIFFRAIRHTDTPLPVLREAGFNTLWIDDQAPPAVIEQAANLGFWIVPALPLADEPDGPTDGHTHLTANGGFARRVSRFVDQDAVLFWDLGGGGLALEQSSAVSRTAQLVRAADPQRLLAADVWDGLKPYSRNVNLLGVHRWILMTGLELPQYREWLEQRRLLANPGTFTWTWVQTHLPDWHTSMVYDHSGTGPFEEPVGPLPEQIRLLTYTALAGGCRGLGFWSDRFLADSHQGRDRLLALALLNQELQMLEPLLVAADAPSWVDTSDPSIKAAVFHTDRALLVLPIFIGQGAQFCPGQGGAANLQVTVPLSPWGTQAWEVTPGQVHALKAERVWGGLKVTLPEFGLTTAIVITADNGPTGLLVRLQDEARRRRKLAAQWAHDLAEAELDKAARIHAELEQAGHRLPDGQILLDDARKRLQHCAQLYNDGDYAESYAEAKRAARPVQILMRAHWEKAAGDLDSPVASPYAVSYFTLPRHWRFADKIKQAEAGPNVIPGGDFELDPGQPTDAWSAQEVALDEVELQARRVTDTPHAGKQCALLEIKPKDKDLPPGALERTYLGIHSPAVHLEPGTLVRLSAWVRIPDAIKASPDGVLLYDSAGGEPLAIRLPGPNKKWKQFSWYRTVPASGNINMSLALTGLGKAYFDDVRIEPLRPGARDLTASAAQSLRSPKPEPDRGASAIIQTSATDPRR
jgi:hypothetical protein